MDNSNDKITTPGADTTGQTKQDDLRKSGQALPEEKGKKDLGSQEEPRKFGQDTQGINKPQQK